MGYWKTWTLIAEGILDSSVRVSEENSRKDNQSTICQIITKIVLTCQWASLHACCMQNCKENQVFWKWTKLILKACLWFIDVAMATAHTSMSSTIKIPKFVLLTCWLKFLVTKGCGVFKKYLISYIYFPFVVDLIRDLKIRYKKLKANRYNVTMVIMIIT